MSSLPPVGKYPNPVNNRINERRGAEEDYGGVGAEIYGSRHEESVNQSGVGSGRFSVQ
jgi:hypothetical protein